MKKFWLLSLLTLLVLAGCSANANGPKDGPGLYKQKCASCHGSNLKGAPAGPPVLNMKSKYNEEELAKLIIEGKGMMPGKLLTEEENELVTKWLIEQ